MSPSKGLQRWVLRASLVVAIASTLAACWHGGSPGPQRTIVGSNFVLASWDVDGPLRETQALRGYPTMEGRTLSFDRTAGTVTIRYTRAGRAVVETWRATRTD